MKATSILIILFGLIPGLTYSQRTSWPMINGDAMRTSRADITMSFPLKIAETWDIGFGSENGMIVTEDYLFLIDPGDSNIVFAVDIHTGASLWQFGVPGTGSSANFIPAAWQHIVIAGGQGADGVYALRQQTGEVLWFKQTGSSYTRAPLITDGLLLIPGRDSLLCVDLANGVDQWAIPGPIPQCSPAADNSNVYFGKDGMVHAVSKFTGTVKWMKTVPNGHFSSYTLDDDGLYVSDYNGSQINALDKGDGSTLWTVSLDTNMAMNQYSSCFAQTDNHILVKFFVNESNRNHYMVLDKATGNEIGRFEGGWMNYGSPTIINNYLVDYAGGNLLFSTIPDGDTAYMITLPDLGVTDQILAANDRIYVGAYGPSVHVLESGTTGIREVNSGFDINVYPNPVADLLHVDFKLDRSSNIRVEVTSIDGAIQIADEHDNMATGDQAIALPVRELAKGLYILSLIVDDIVVPMQFVKQQ